jgi:hypothetical protein
VKYRIIASLLLILVLVVLALRQAEEQGATSAVPSSPSLTSDEAALKSLKIN